MLAPCLLALALAWAHQRPVMGGPLFLLVSRRQSEQMPLVADPTEMEPSCAELRAMWRRMHRMARHSQMSNEIPRLPYGKVMLREPQQEFLGFAGGDPSLASSRRRSSVLPPPPGRFLDRPLPVKALGGVFGTVVRSPDEKPRWRTVDGAFGRFDDDKYGRVVQSTGDPGRAAKEQTCRRWKGRPCRREADCGGCGLLRCVAAKCRPVSTAAKKVSSDEWGTWSSSPFESSQLGISQKRDLFEY